ncbi:MAG: cobalamin biosynthesis protein, partial [Clostridiales bacterium]|nr:cobalamin biosynthesis protein [Clostridiales bacterium]
VFAPMFYMMLGGGILGFAYKSINTMDSMVGYKNEKYLYFGRFAAKLDDVVNYLPARLAALLLIAAAPLCGLDGKNAWKIWRRDRRNHASPNSAQTESAAAGALHVQLAGDAYYFGKLYKKPYIGDPDRSVEPEDIVRVNRLMVTASVLSLALLSVLKLFLLILFL